jgi:hypothetical protein
MNDTTANRGLAPEDEARRREYVLDRFDDSISYYWKASRYNKRAFKTTRYLTIILGAVVTLIASLASASFVKPWATAFAVATPVLAAILSIVGGFSQTFQWGAAWQEMVLMAEGLEKERDRIRVSRSEDIDPQKELALLNELVLTESGGFFERILGGAKPTGAAQE